MFQHTLIYITAAKSIGSIRAHIYLFIYLLIFRIYMNCRTFLNYSKANPFLYHTCFLSFNGARTTALSKSLLIYWWKFHCWKCNYPNICLLHCTPLPCSIVMYHYPLTDYFVDAISQRNEKWVLLPACTTLFQKWLFILVYY